MRRDVPARAAITRESQAGITALNVQTKPLPERVGEKARQLMPIKILRVRPVRCMGCGKVGHALCDHCFEIFKKTQERIAKLRGTVQLKFGMHTKL